ncbi:hypothetical protein ACFPRL_03685 [Pseudoclavibacter helvolus]
MPSLTRTPSPRSETCPTSCAATGCSPCCAGPRTRTPPRPSPWRSSPARSARASSTPNPTGRSSRGDGTSSATHPCCSCGSTSRRRAGRGSNSTLTRRIWKPLLRRKHSSVPGSSRAGSATGQATCGRPTGRRSQRPTRTATSPAQSGTG